MRKVELGVFMPIASNGFLMSKAAPRYHPTFALHREIAEIAEAIGLDYLFWMGKWMGFGGETDFWRNTLEPIALSGAIAPLTSRLKLFATINPLLYHPVVAAKLIATVNDVSQGRFGINIVTGNTLEEFEQMGIVPDGYGDYRYDYAEEWLTVIKRLWSEDRTSFDGRFFHLDNCVSDPKPAPHPTIISAGLSDEGLAFAARHSDYQFVGLRADDVARVKQFAAAQQRSVRVVSNLLLLHADTDGAAEARLAELREQLDHEAVENLIASIERDERSSYNHRTAYLRAPTMVGFGSGTPVTGAPDTMAETLARLIVESGVDGIQFTFVDFAADLRHFGASVLPRLRTLLAAEGIAVGTS